MSISRKQLNGIMSFGVLVALNLLGTPLTVSAKTDATPKPVADDPFSNLLERANHPPDIWRNHELVPMSGKDLSHTAAIYGGILRQTSTLPPDNTTAKRKNVASNTIHADNGFADLIRQNAVLSSQMSDVQVALTTLRTTQSTASVQIIAAASDIAMSTLHSFESKTDRVLGDATDLQRRMQLQLFGLGRKPASPALRVENRELDQVTKSLKKSLDEDQTLDDYLAGCSSESHKLLADQNRAEQAQANNIDPYPNDHRARAFMIWLVCIVIASSFYVGRLFFRPTSGPRMKETSQDVWLDIRGPGKSQRVYITKGSPRILGRSIEADIPIFDKAVSEMHAHVQLVGARLVLTDMGSENGTFVDGMRMTNANLMDGQQFQCGQTMFTFRIKKGYLAESDIAAMNQDR